MHRSQLAPRVVQTAALLILTPIFDPDMPEEMYAYREGHQPEDALLLVQQLVHAGIAKLSTLPTLGLLRLSACASAPRGRSG